MLLDIIILLVGFVIIIKSSDVLVDAASSLALKLRVPKKYHLVLVLLKLLYLLEVLQMVMELWLLQML